VEDERDAEVGVDDLADERHCLPVEQRVDDVRLGFLDAVDPAALRGHVDDVAEGKGAGRVPVLRPLGPKAREVVAALLEGDDPLRVEAERAGQQDPQPARAREPPLDREAAVADPFVQPRPPSSVAS
jgi:hypothetical protein